MAVPESVATVLLSFSSIGYVSQQLSGAPGNPVTVQLKVEYKTFYCTDAAYPRAEIGLSSGIRYAPVGASLKLYGNRLARLPLINALVSLPNFVAVVKYQTNFDRNHVFAASLVFPAWQRRHTVTTSFDYQLLQAVPANIRFQSYSAIASIGPFRPTRLLPQSTVLAGGGYAHYRPLVDANTAEITGFGYSLGLENDYPSRYFGLTSSVLATRWPGYWQWQAQLIHPIRRFQAGVAFNHIRQYSEFSVLLKRYLY